MHFGGWTMSFALAALGCGGSQDDGEHTGNVGPNDPVPSEQSCGLNSGWAGDEYCILPPPADKGFQIHYGPSNYEDQAEVEKYLIQPGLDTNIYEPKTSGNTSDIFFYKRQYRMRKGSHHLIVSAGGSGSLFGLGRRLGGSQNVVKDNPQGELPPENVGIGMPLTANSPLIMNLHHFNPTNEALLREAWVNFWYVDAATVTQEAKEMFLWAQGGTVQPGQTAVVRGSKAIDTDGRVLTMYGHRHSNNVRFSVWRVRNGVSELVYEDYNWEEPAVFEFNSLTKNPPPDPVGRVGGAYSGILDLKVGDALEWECEVVNTHDFPVSFGENEAVNSEMCILVGDAVGPTLLSLAF